MIPTVLVLVLFVVVLVRMLPGDAVDILLSEEIGASDLNRQQLEARLGLDKSLPEEYGSYAVGVLRGDLGNSLWSQQPVNKLLIKKLGVTLELSGLALLVGATFGISIGVLSAVTRGSVMDYVLRSFAIFGLSVPNFAIATAVTVLPAVWWGWSPSLIYKPPGDGLWPHISQFFVPALVLGLALSASLMRITRTMMLEVLGQDYIRTARAKGLGGFPVIMRHALRNALIPVISLLGIQVAFLVSGTVIIENIFGLPGMGRELIYSMNSRDYPVVQGLTVMAGLLVIAVNLMVDLSYGVLDPRTRAR